MLFRSWNIFLELAQPFPVCFFLWFQQLWKSIYQLIDVIYIPNSYGVIIASICTSSFSDCGINYWMQMKKATSRFLLRRGRNLSILLSSRGKKWLHQDLETLTFSYITESQAKPRLAPISQRPTATCSSFQPAQVI